MDKGLAISIDRIKIDSRITRLELEATKIMTSIKDNEKKEEKNLELKINELIKKSLVVTEKLEELTLVMKELVIENKI